MSIQNSLRTRLRYSMHSQWLNRRKMEIAQLDAANEEFYSYFSLPSTNAIDNTFALPDDEELTPDEIRQIDEFWAPYEFAYPQINYNSFKIFKNRCGYFSPLHCPPGIRAKFFNKYFISKSYNLSFQNKALLHKLYPNIKQPVTIVRRANGLYFDEYYNRISLEEALQICADAVTAGHELIVKPSGRGGGDGIQFINTSNKDTILAAIKSLGISAMVIQHVLTQSAAMARFNPVSVNTMRVTTLLYQEDVHILSALVRVGGDGNRVDNWCAGGSLVGIDLRTNRCLPWALTKSNTRITVLPSGLDLSAEPYEIPNIEKVWELVKKAHYHNPYIRMISWDIALDENDEPLMIENNFAGMMQLHEATTGPLFGDLTKPLLDEYLLKRFHLKKANLEFNYLEYHDHIVLEKYVSPLSDVTVPSAIDGKPVTEIGATCFRDRGDITEITVPKSIFIPAKTFAACPNLIIRNV